jgi:regulator of sirC expression with transglutaminase-like and TPR domain
VFEVHGVTVMPEPKSWLAHFVGISNHCLFEEWGFKGNEFNYYDPDNSFLNKVFDRRLGIPITLSIIYLEVASRLGLDVAGVGFPGHFLVKIMLPSGNYYVDPFNKGRIVTDDLFRELSQSLYDTQADFKPEYIIVVDNHQILRRVLTNLKRIYFREGDLYRGLAVVERLIILSPGEASFYRDRGLLHYGLKEYTKAYQDLRSYLQENPLDEDAKTIRDLVSSIRQRLGSLN